MRSSGCLFRRKLENGTLCDCKERALRNTLGLGSLDKTDRALKSSEPWRAEAGRTDVLLQLEINGAADESTHGRVCERRKFANTVLRTAGHGAA